MRRCITMSLLVLTSFLGATSTVSAQYAPPTGYPQAGRPALSPYLNLLRGGDPAANYYSGVVPEQVSRSNFAAIQGSLRALNTELYDLGQQQSSSAGSIFDQTPLPATGHRTYYGSPNNPIGQMIGGNTRAVSSSPLRGQQSTPPRR